MPGLGTGGNGIPPYDLEGNAAAWLPHSKDAVRLVGKAAAWLPHSKDAERPEGVPTQERGHESTH